MDLTILITCSLIFAIMAFVYLLSFTLKEADEKFALDFKVIKIQKAIAIFSLVVFVALTALSIMFTQVYENLLIKNIKLLFLLGLIFCAGWIDNKKHIIPNKIIVVGLIVRVPIYVIELISNPDVFFENLKSDLITTVVITLFLFCCRFIVRNGIGMGDIKLIIVMCLYQGFEGVMSSIFFSLIVAWLLSVFFLITKKKTRKDAIAFAPAILIGTYISIFLTGM